MNEINCKPPLKIECNFKKVTLFIMEQYYDIINLFQVVRVLKQLFFLNFESIFIGENLNS